MTAIARIFSDSDHYIVDADCCVYSKPSLSTFINPNTVSPRGNKLRLLTSFNAVIAQYMQETTRRDIGVFLQVIQDTEKQCFTEVPLKQCRPYISGPTFGIRF